MKKILIIKYDGIGDYLLIRMFWKQLSLFAKENDFSLNFLGANKFSDLIQRYDSFFFDNTLCIRDKNIYRGFFREQILFFIPKYKRRLEKEFLLEKFKKQIFDIGINAHFSRYKEVKKIFTALMVEKKYSIFNKDDLDYLDSYDDIIKISSDKFVLERYKEYFSAIFKHEFKIPSLELPFENDEAKKTAFSIIGKDKYIAFIPFSASDDKNWSINNFIEIADKISKVSDKKIVLLGGGVDVKKEEVLQINKFSKSKHIINLFNKINLDDAMKIAAASEYALTVDTSLMHCTLIGGAETVCLSSGFAKKVFVEYPKIYNVKQTIFYPEESNGDIGDINKISVDKVWNHIQNNWRL